MVVSLRRSHADLLLSMEAERGLTCAGDGRAEGLTAAAQVKQPGTARPLFLGSAHPPDTTPFRQGAVEPPFVPVEEAHP